MTRDQKGAQDFAALGDETAHENCREGHPHQGIKLMSKKKRFQ